MNQICTQILMLLLVAQSSFAQVFWSEDFSDVQLPAGWLTEDANPNSEVIWEICTTPGACRPADIVNESRFISSTANNNYAILNSEAGGSDFQGNHISRLTTPAINCTGKQSVFLEFESLILSTNNNPAETAILKVWAGGDTMVLKPYPRLFRDNSNEISKNPEVLNFDISTVAANQAEVYIQWQWTSKNEFFWCLDDVKLNETDIIRPVRAVWFERFNNGGEGWTMTTNMPDADWIWDSFGDISNSAAYPPTTDPIQSASAHDGVMLFPADYYTFMGVPASEPYPQYIAELISPIIDLSETANPITLQFTQLVSGLNPSAGGPVNEQGEIMRTSFQVSLDGGITWEPPQDANETLGLQILRYNTQRFPIDGLEGQSNVRLKFTFAGDVFFWALDDISLEERASYDIKINPSFYAIMPNAITPLSQVASEVFMAEVENVGLALATGATLNLRITQQDSEESLFDSDIFFDEIEPGEIPENTIFLEDLDPMSIMETGIYTGVYTLNMDSIDAIPNDNMVNWSFEISDSTFAKENGRTGNRTPQNEVAYTYGNFYYVPNGEGYNATSMSFGIYNTEQLENRTVNIYLYKWIEDLNNDGFIQSNEREGPIGFNSYTFNGLEGRDLINIPLSVDGEAVPLEDSTAYILTVEYNPMDNQAMLFNISDEYNYLATATVGSAINQARYASVVDVGNTGTFNTAGLGFNKIPQIRMHIQPIHASYEIIKHPNFEVILSPNPSSGIFNVEIESKENIEDLQILIRETSGKIVNSKKIKDFQQKELTFDARKWPAGLYLLEFLSPKASITKKLIIQN